MIDVDETVQAHAERWRTAVDAGARPVAAPDAIWSGWARPFMLAASVAVVLLIVAGALLVRTDRSDDDSASVQNLVGVTWRDPVSGGTAVYTAKTVQTFDGCVRETRTLTVRGNHLDVGGPVGDLGACTGTPRPSAGAARTRYDRVQAAMTKLDHVLWNASSWTLAGGVLHVAGAAGSLQFVPLDQQLPLRNVSWTLTRISGYTQPPGDYFKYAKGALFIGLGQDVATNDLCGDLKGHVVVTADTIAFGRLDQVGPRCSPTGPPPFEPTVVSGVLAGRARYTIRGDRLSLTGHNGYSLVYEPTP